VVYSAPNRGELVAAHSLDLLLVCTKFLCMMGSDTAAIFPEEAAFGYDDLSIGVSLVLVRSGLPISRWLCSSI